MHRFWVLSLFVLLNTVSVAEAKVCFLPSVFGGDGCITDEQYANCEGFDRTSPCPSGQEEISCTKNGETRYKCYCRADTYLLSEHPEYKCKSGRPVSEECGCAAEDLECKDEYIYKGDGFGFCTEYQNATGVDGCILPNGQAWYKNCKCDEEAFPYTCFKTGLVAPAGDDFKCRDTTGNVSYDHCVCDAANGWSSDCSSRSDGCTLASTSVFGGTNSGNGYCYKCEEDLCSTSDQLNLSTYFCALTPSVDSDCESLGYIDVSTTGGRCPGDSGMPGEVGLKCPFDQDYMKCDPNSCPYTTKSECESATTDAICVQNEKGCYVVSNPETSGCLDGFTAGLDELSCPTDATYQANGRIEDNEPCGKCLCSAAEGCIYTYNIYDTAPITINNQQYAPVYAGQADLKNKCCNNYYSVCNSRCNGRDFIYDRDANMKDDGYAICDACGKKYYTISACKYGYTLQNNRCVAQTCDTTNGYNTVYQSETSCTTSNGLYQGALGWTLEKQANGPDQFAQSGDLFCTKCICSADPNVCKYDESNKGNGTLADLCCNGKYKTLNAPDGATEEACEDENAETITSYELEDGTVCIIEKCKCGYKLINNVCVAKTDSEACSSGFSTTAQTVSDCGAGLYWKIDVQTADSNGCHKSGDKLCTKCSCTESSDACSYNDSNKGSGTLSDLCCNGKYKNCAQPTDKVGYQEVSANWAQNLQNNLIQNADTYSACGKHYGKITSCILNARLLPSGEACECDDGYQYNSSAHACVGSVSCDDEEIRSTCQNSSLVYCEQDTNGCYTSIQCKYPQNTAVLDYEDTPQVVLEGMEHFDDLTCYDVTDCNTAAGYYQSCPSGYTEDGPDPVVVSGNDGSDYSCWHCVVDSSGHGCGIQFDLTQFSDELDVYTQTLDLHYINMYAPSSVHHAFVGDGSLCQSNVYDPCSVNCYSQYAVHDQGGTHYTAEYASCMSQCDSQQNACIHEASNLIDAFCGQCHFEYDDMCSSGSCPTLDGTSPITSSDTPCYAEQVTCNDQEIRQVCEENPDVLSCTTDENGCYIGIACNHNNGYLGQDEDSTGFDTYRDSTTIEITADFSCEKIYYCDYENLWTENEHLSYGEAYAHISDTRSLGTFLTCYHWEPRSCEELTGETVAYTPATKPANLVCLSVTGGGNEDYLFGDGDIEGGATCYADCYTCQELWNSGEMDSDDFWECEWDEGKEYCYSIYQGGSLLHTSEITSSYNCYAASQYYPECHACKPYECTSNEVTLLDGYACPVGSPRELPNGTSCCKKCCTKDLNPTFTSYSWISYDSNGCAYDGGSPCGNAPSCSDGSQDCADVWEIYEACLQSYFSSYSQRQTILKNCTPEPLILDSCPLGYYKKEDECVLKDCAYYDMYDTDRQCGITNSTGNCKHCKSVTQNTGSRTITCYQKTNESCMTCEDYGYYSDESSASENADPDCSADSAVNYITMQNDLGETIICYETMECSGSGGGSGSGGNCEQTLADCYDCCTAQADPASVDICNNYCYGNSCHCRQSSSSGSGGGGGHGGGGGQSCDQYDASNDTNCRSGGHY